MSSSTETPASPPALVVPADLKSRLKKSYDAIAPQYNKIFIKEDEPIRLDYLSRLIKLLQDSGKTDAKVLELGCGAGVPGTRTLLTNESPKFHVIGNDLSTTQLALARENLGAFESEGRLELVQGDMTALDFAPASLDAVIGFYSIIHLPREEQTGLLGNITKWLKPGGLFLGNFSEEETEATFEEFWLKEKEGWMFWSGWGAEKSATIVEESGLEVLVKELRQDVVNVRFLWVLAKKPEGAA